MIRRYGIPVDHATPVDQIRTRQPFHGGVSMSQEFGSCSFSLTLLLDFHCSRPRDFGVAFFHTHNANRVQQQVSHSTKRSRMAMRRYARQTLCRKRTPYFDRGKKRSVEALWRDLFSNTSLWWDHRHEKMNPKFPDFKHKQTQEALWLVDDRNPPWVQAELDAIPTGTIQSNVFAWSQRLRRHVKAGQFKKTLEVFHQMQQEKICPDPRTFLPVLNACAGLGALGEGRHIHSQIRQVGCEADVYVATCLVDMYAKCGSIEDAWNVFKKMPGHDVVTWSAMISGYAKSGQGGKAMDLFRKMQQEGVEPNAVTFVGVLNACASTTALKEGRFVHQQIIERGCDSDVYVANCVVDMYAKCGSMEDAWNVFNNMQQHDVVTWNAIIGGYVKSGQGLKAVELFQQMEQEGVEPDAITFIGVLNACASAAALEEGRRVHEQIIRTGWHSYVFVANCLIDMYAKCGSIDDAWNVFSKVKKCDVVTWNAMIGGYAMHGQAKKAIRLFERMGKEAVEINEITFICLLSACSRGGLVKKGLRYFKSMSSCFDILPTAEHYACMVDLLGRAGRLGEAEELMKKRMPSETDVPLWRSLLGACRIYGNIKVAERAAQRCWELDPENTSGYVLLSNIYAAAGKWDKTAANEERQLSRKVWKEAGRTWIEVDSMLHSFQVNDKKHPQILEICTELERVSAQMTEAGYLPEVRFVSIEEKSLSHHSEKLAISHGLMSMPSGTPVSLMSNLRVCPNSHDTAKCIANMVRRVLNVKDPNCFHRFEGGIYSCKSYW